GTVWFAWERPGLPCVSVKHRLYGDRESVRRKAVIIALQGIQAIYAA
ncbi:MAG: damage-inducible protein CinA, partial [Methylococcus sp.]